MTPKRLNSLALTLGQKVFSPEHENAAGTVIRIHENGDASIEFVTPSSHVLPYGHIITEFWPLADQKELVIL
jgi:hypothetical protein